MGRSCEATASGPEAVPLSSLEQTAKSLKLQCPLLPDGVPGFPRVSRRFGDTCAQHTRRPAGAQRTAPHPGSAGLITEQGTATWSCFQFTPDSPDPRKVQRHLPRAAGEARPAVGKGGVGYLLPLRGSPAGHLLSRFRKSRGRSGSFERPKGRGQGRHVTKTPGLPVGSTGPARIAPEHARPHLADAADPRGARHP